MAEETIAFGAANPDYQAGAQQQAPTATLSIRAKLMEMQATLKVEKGQWNDFGKYKYRSKEDILEAAKPLCHERGLVLLVDDDVTALPNGWVYVCATARIQDVETGERMEARGWAREPETKKGMDGSQITGTASSYAGKRALGNLFAIDDTKDSDALPAGQAKQIAGEPKMPPAQGEFTARCQSCGRAYVFRDVNSYMTFLSNPGCCPNPAWEVE